MAYQYSIPVRNAQLDQVEAIVGATAHLRLYSGTEPVDCAAAPTGTMLLEIILPADWMNAAAAGAKTLLGVWSATAAAAGNVGYGRIWNTAVTVCGIQFNVTATGGGGDVTMDAVALVIGQTVLFNSFTITAQNA